MPEAIRSKNRVTLLVKAVAGRTNRVEFCRNHRVAEAFVENAGLFEVPNSVSFNTANGAETIQAAGGYFVKEDASGNISMNASSFTVQNGVALIGLGNGNVVTVSNMKSGLGADLTTNSQANQLVSAMASYSGSAAGVTSTVAAQAPVEASLFASAHQ